MSQVDKGADRLEQAADVYSNAVKRFEELENEFDLKLAKARVHADDTYSRETGKYPSQDRRQDIALIAVREESPQLMADFTAAKAAREAQAVRFRALQAAVSARQSLLRALQG